MESHCFFANLLQSFYSIVDMLVVGNVVGSTGLAAISNASMISFIINSICTGVAIGGTVLAARCKGAGDRVGQRETIGTLFSLSAAAAVLVTLTGLAGYPTVFRLLGVPEAAMKDACDYMFIICCGTICVFGYNAVCAVMRGMGDSRSPLYLVLVATVVNIILDILLVGVWGMGTKGAACATVFSQGVSFAVSVVHLRRQDFVFDFRRMSFALLSADYRYVQCPWHESGCRRGNRTQSQYLCRHALLGRGTGCDSHDGPEHGCR